MKPFKLLAVYRHPKFSNNAIEADRLILEAAVAAFEKKYPAPLRVEFLEEAELASNKDAFNLVLTMAQSTEALAEFDRQKPLLPVVWNSTQAVRNCYRNVMSQKLQHAKVAYAPFFVARSWNDFATHASAEKSYWLKRGDFHAIQDDDVSLAESLTEAKEKFMAMQKRGIAELIVQEHIPGDIYKFYGVNGGFFRPIRVRKFLTEDISPRLDLAEAYSRKAAELLNLQIYGGDFVVDQQGNPHIIDVNDWPSFRICREDAAEAISRYATQFILSSMKETVVALQQ